MSLMADEDRDLERAALEERAAVVAWLRERGRLRLRTGEVVALGATEALADAIERGEHVGRR